MHLSQSSHTELHFCTYFDQHYLLRGLLLYQSLKEYCPNFRLWILCMDEAVYDLLQQINAPEIRPITLEELERHDPELLDAKQSRSRVEYYFTCSPSLPLYVLNQQPEIEMITYVDADLFFFSSPLPIYNELGEASVGIIGHRFPRKLLHLEQAGRYNVGWITFKNNDQALDCLQWWHEKCLEWCYDRIEETRYADQKYLDQWQDRFDNVVEIEHKGANLAPWNLDNYIINEDSNSNILVDEQPLIFFHFQRLHKLTSWAYNANLSSYQTRLTRLARQKIYGTYIRSLHQIEVEMAPYLSFSHKMDNIRGIQSKAIDYKPTFNLAENSKKYLRIMREFGLGRGIFIYNNNAL